jgi:hypothetical protein
MRISRSSVLRSLTALGLLGAVALPLGVPSTAHAWWWRPGWGWRGGVVVGIAPPRVVVGPPAVVVGAPPVYAPAYPPPPGLYWVPGYWNGPYWVPGHWA